nr:hypothetical protein [Acidobacteriota bacterium]
MRKVFGDIFCKINAPIEQRTVKICFTKIGALFLIFYFFAVRIETGVCDCDEIRAFLKTVIL